MTEEEVRLIEEFRLHLEHPKPKSYNQARMFEEIWEEREHYSEITGIGLLRKGHFLWHNQFMHVLAKGTNTKMRLFKPNIMLGLPNEHTNQEAYKIFTNRRTMLHRVYETVMENKIFD